MSVSHSNWGGTQTQALLESVIEEFRDRKKNPEKYSPAQVKRAEKTLPGLEDEYKDLYGKLAP